MKIKQNYNISKAKSIVLGMLAGLFALAASCERDDPMPQPQPGPEPTPVVPTKEITIDFDFFDNWGNMNKDTVKKYTDMEDVKFLFLNIVNEDGGQLSSGLSANVFHSICDTLQTRFDISNKVRGSGTIFVSKNGGAQWPDSLPNAAGMAASDSTKLANWGYQIKRFQGIPARSK